jgi:hypothetical protein
LPPHSDWYKMPAAVKNWDLERLCVWTKWLERDLDRRLERPLRIHLYMVHKGLLSLTYVVSQVHLRFLTFFLNCLQYEVGRAMA